MDDTDLNGSDPEMLVDRIENLMSVVARLEESNVTFPNEVMASLQQARELLQDVVNDHHLRESSQSTPRLFGVGRPSYDIPEVQLRYLIELGFSVPAISHIFGVSVRTIRRRMQWHQLSIRLQYSSLSDSSLDDIVREIVTDFPNCGCQRMDGFLRSKGLRIQQRRIRESLRRVDPDGVLLRSLEIHVIRRRAYHVPGPLALWHIDGYHKLIR